MLQKRFSEHGVEKDPSEWFHAVIYCVQAGGGRIENIDTQIISDFVKQGYRVVVALTKIDQLLNEDDRVTLKKTIESEVSKVSGKTEKITVISVCSEKKKKRMGESKPVGREDLIDAILAGWLDALKDRLPHSIVALLAKRLDGYAGELEKYIRNHEVSGRPEGNDELVGSCRRKIDARMESLLDKDLQEVSGLLITRCQRIGCALQNVFKVSTNDNMSHRAFNHFFGQNEAAQGKRTAAYIASLGIYALYRSKSSKYRAAERQRITALITSDEAGLPVYTFERKCKESEEVESGDETHHVIFNASDYEKETNPEIKAFLAFVKNNKAESDLTREIATMVQTKKFEQSFINEYLAWSMHDKDVESRGRKVGREEGIALGEKRLLENLKRMMASGKLTAEDISGLSVQDIQNTTVN